MATASRSFFSPSVDELAESDVLRAAVRGASRSLYCFLRHAWPHVPRADGPLILTPAIEVVCNYLQAAAEGKRRSDGVKVDRLVINLPPETMKSILISVVFPAWLWTRDQSAGVLSVCYDKDLGARDASDSRALMESGWFKVLWPEVEFRDDTNAKSNYRTVQGGQRLSTTYRGRITGEHPRFFIWDDPLNVRDEDDPKVKKALKTFYRKRVSTRGRTKGVVHIIAQQRIAVDDPSSIAYEDNEKARQEGRPEPWTIVKFAMRFDPAIAMKDYGFGCDKRKPGELLDPVRLPEEVVASMERDLGESANAQLQQEPTEDKGSLFNMDYWQEIEEKELPERFDEVCRYWDKAASDGKGCQTAGVLMGRKDTVTRHGERISDYYLLHVHAGHWDVDRVEDEIELMKDLDLSRFGVSRLVVAMEEEGGSGGKVSVRSTEKRMRGVRFIAVSPAGKSKPKRAQPLAREMRRGHFFVVKGVWTPKLKEQFQRFPNGLIDQADAASGSHLVLEGTLGKPKKKPNVVVAGITDRAVCKTEGCSRPPAEGSDYCCDNCETAGAFGDAELVKCCEHDAECVQRYFDSQQ